jgi:hypothetical protein
VLSSHALSAAGHGNRGNDDPQRRTGDEVKGQVGHPYQRREEHKVPTINERCMSIATSTLWVWS